MLENFFQLNGDPEVFASQQKLTDHLRISNDLRNVIFKPDTLNAPDTPIADNPFRSKIFTNVSFKDTMIQDIIFRECRFVDCLFIATRFINCEFRSCTFKDCNPYKVAFTNTYIDPSVFEGMLDPFKHSNIGINLFQQLYENSYNMRQIDFAASAEFNRHIWKRYMLNYEHRQWKNKNWKYFREWIPNVLSHYITGYGIRFQFLAIWTLLFGAGSMAANFFFWDSFSVVGRDGLVQERGFIEVLYYTANIVGGVGDMTPASPAGRVWFVVEAFFGLIIVSLFVRWLVKLALR